MSPTATLKLEPITLEDIPTLTEIWFAAFSTSDLVALWPDTPGVRTWWTEANRDDLVNKPFRKFVKVIDTASIDAPTGRARIAAYAKWDLSMPEERGARYPVAHPDMPKRDFDVFLRREEDERKRVMGDQRHYYLDTVATHPDYQRRGAGSLLVKWGCELADRDQVAAYVDASKDGAALYQKFGFVDLSGPGAGDIASMARPRAGK